MKHKPHRKEKKTLAMSGLLGVVRDVFDKVTRTVKRQKISMTDCLMSALAMFGMKSPSLLAFDGPKLEEPIRHNLKTLYKVTTPPSDTHMREVLDEVDPKTWRGAFLSVFHEAQRGKLLERRTLLNSRHLGITLLLL